MCATFLAGPGQIEMRKGLQEEKSTALLQVSKDVSWAAVLGRCQGTEFQCGYG